VSKRAFRIKPLKITITGCLSEDPWNNPNWSGNSWAALACDLCSGALQSKGHRLEQPKNYPTNSGYFKGPLTKLPSQSGPPSTINVACLQWSLASRCAPKLGKAALPTPASSFSAYPDCWMLHCPLGSDH